MKFFAGIITLNYKERECELRFGPNWPADFAGWQASSTSWAEMAVAVVDVLVVTVAMAALAVVDLLNNLEHLTWVNNERLGSKML